MNYWRTKRHEARTDAWSGGGQAFRTWLRSGTHTRTRIGIARGLVVIAVLGLIIGAFAIPLAWTGSRDSCTAFETALLRRSMYDVFGAQHQRGWDRPRADRERRSASGGLIGQQIARMEYSWLPHAVSCAVLFWQVRISG